MTASRSRPAPKLFYPRRRRERLRAIVSLKATSNVSKTAENRSEYQPQNMSDTQEICLSNREAAQKMTTITGDVQGLVVGHKDWRSSKRRERRVLVVPNNEAFRALKNRCKSTGNPSKTKLMTHFKTASHVGKAEAETSPPDRN